MKLMLSTLMTSWKTTAAGITQWLTMVAPQVGTLFDTDATTNPDWNLVVASTVILVGLLFARDGDKSSESHHVH